MDYLIIKKEQGYDEYPVTKYMPEIENLKPFVWTKIDETEALLLKEEESAYERASCFTIAQKEADICIPDLCVKLLIENKTLYIEGTGNIYRNGLSVDNHQSIEIESGDVVFIQNSKLTFFEEYIILVGNKEEIIVSLPERELRKKPYENFPRYKRSPRIIKKISEDKVEISKPPAKSQIKKGSLIQMILSPLVMVAVTVTMGLVMKRGIYVFISALTTVLTTVFSVVKYMGEKKECKEKDKVRLEIYENYLLGIRKRLNQLKTQELEAMTYNYPSIIDIQQMVNHYSSRIYERSSNDDDFLTVSLGNSKSKASFAITTSYDELSTEKDELEMEAKEIKDLYAYIDNKPVAIDLKRAHLGLVGEKENIHEQLKLIVAQLTTLQSYHDLQIITIYEEQYKEDFAWMRWYPHTKIRAINVFGTVYSERMRDQVLGSMNQIIKERKQKRDESKKEGRFLPHFLFIIDEPKLIMDHSIMEYLEKEGDELGFSIIYTTHLKANLPEYVGTILMVENSETGTLLLNEKQMVNKKLVLNRVGDVGLEKMARNLSVLVHEKGIVSQIPENITFFDMYEVEHPDQLNIEERWGKNESHKSLAVLLGVRAEKDYVYLNLHEKAHGPHGLVAGTTGSGKSEIVQSYILSLAVNFHPYEVGFLLIDYKGGGMAGLFKDLPHLLGTITNLDGSESMRAMASIKSELARRQQIFSENNVNHINAYNKLFKSGKVSEPIPHLFLISDEFAELKKEQPEFMTELVSAARIGRSLGIHLILATQKPSGVVDDQIWTNSKFKLALKVQNESDSKEILKTADAASITQPGRAYLQVGNNEIYELFQSAWSGAAYSDELVGEQADNRVYVVNELGQGELINADLSEETDGNQLKATQLDVTITYIKKIFEGYHLPSVKRPWMPSLPQDLISPHIAGNVGKDVNDCVELDLTVPVGMVDIPEHQQQTEYWINFIDDGNAAVFASQGFGKSTLLTTVMVSLAVKNTPELLQYYILDFGNSALIPLKNLPHTVDYITFDDADKINKLTKIIGEECRRRKQLFAHESAVNFDMYNRVSGKKLPAIILFIDNYDMIKEIEGDLEPFLAGITRDGSGLGIYVMITASRAGAVRFNIINNFYKKIALYLYDKTEANAIVGRTAYPLAEIKGRGLVKVENINQMQVYKAVVGENPIEYMENLKGLVQSTADNYTGAKLRGIPMLPEVLDGNSFMEFLPAHTDIGLIPIALDTEKVEVQYLNLQHSKQIIVGSTQSGKTNLLKLLLQLRSSEMQTFLVSAGEGELYEFQSAGSLTYIQTMEDAAQMLLELEELVTERKEGLEEAREKEPKLLARDYYGQQEHVLIVIEDWDSFVDLVKQTKNTAADKILAEAVAVNLTIVAATPSNKMRGIDGLSKFMRDTIYGVVLGVPGDQGLFSIPRAKITKSETGIGYIYQKGEVVQVKIPKA